MFSGQKTIRSDRRLFGTRGADSQSLILALAAIFAVAAVVVWTLYRIEREVQNQTAESLRTVLATTQEGMGLWINGIEDPVSVIARRPEVISAVQAQIRLARQHSSLRGSTALRSLRDFLAPFLELYKYDFVVVDGHWTEIAAPTDDVLGKKMSKTPEAQPIASALNGQVATGLYVADSPEATPHVTVAAPVLDDHGAIEAALVFRLDPGSEFNGITSRARIGATGETYIFSRHGRMITRSRFRPDRTLYVADRAGGTNANGQLTRMAQSALLGNSGVDVEGYPDYRGVEVFGAWTWNPVLNVGIATEIDRSEALTPYRTIRALTLIMLVLVIGTFVILLTVIRHRNRVLANNYAFRESIKARQDTLAVVSHDLRAPLSNVILCSTMLAKGDVDHARLTRFAEIISTSSRQMEKLISDLLDVSTMEMGHLRIERKPCDVRTLLDRVRDIFAEQAGLKSIALDISSPAANFIVHADPDRITQVLSNLVGNALKFTPRGGQVSIRTIAGPGEVRFEVRDTGPGISDQARPHVFEQFWQTDSSGKRGRGLGLYIARMIVEGHGGQIWVESDGRNGSRFYFSIPDYREKRS